MQHAVRNNGDHDITGASFVSTTAPQAQVPETITAKRAIEAQHACEDKAAESSQLEEQAQNIPFGVLSLQMYSKPTQALNMFAKPATIQRCD